VRQNPTGRLRLYCDRSCRQRAYETRTAGRRLQDDVDAGVVRATPAERIVERVVRARHPQSPAGWETALQELQGQLADGTISPWNAGRIQQALAGALAQAELLAANAAAASPPRVDERLAEAAEVLLRLAAGAPTTLELLGAALGFGVDQVRQVVLELEDHGLLVARRAQNVVPVDELRVHSRFALEPGG
jgi:biotin operon repressor